MTPFETRKNCVAFWKVRGVFCYFGPLEDRLKAWECCNALRALRGFGHVLPPSGRHTLMVPLHPDDFEHAEAYCRTLDIKRSRKEMLTRRKKKLTGSPSRT